MMADITYRKATITDVEGLARAHADSWKESFQGIINQDHLDGITYEKRENAFRNGFEKNSSYQVIIAVENEEIVGFADFGDPRTHTDRFDAEIYAIYLKKAYQRRGIGKMLIKKVIEQLVSAGKNSMFTLALDVSPYKGFHEKVSDSSFADEIIDFAGEKHQLIGFVWEDLKSRL